MNKHFPHTTLHSALFIAIGIGPLSATTLLCTLVNASELSTRIGVSVTVVADAKLKAEYQASHLQIAPEDIARGYVDASSATRFSVHTNSPSGYLMVFNPLLDLFESVQVISKTTIAHLGRDGGVVVQRGLHAVGTQQDLTFRFFLHALTLPGDYPWPLHLSIRALE
jgi:hypothetical protein